MVRPLPRPWSATMVSIPLRTQKTLEIKGFLGLERPFLDLVSQTPRPQGRGRPLFLCRANGRGRSGGQTAGGDSKTFPLRELESAFRVVFCEMPVTVPTVCFSGFSEGRRGGSAAVCDPNPPRPFARSRLFVDSSAATKTLPNSISKSLWSLQPSLTQMNCWGIHVLVIT